MHLLEGMTFLPTVPDEKPISTYDVWPMWYVSVPMRKQLYSYSIGFVVLLPRDVSLYRKEMGDTNCCVYLHSFSCIVSPYIIVWYSMEFLTWFISISPGLSCAYLIQGGNQIKPPPWPMLSAIGAEANTSKLFSFLYRPYIYFTFCSQVVWVSFILFFILRYRLKRYSLKSHYVFCGERLNVFGVCSVFFNVCSL